MWEGDSRGQLGQIRFVTPVKPLSGDSQEAVGYWRLKLGQGLGLQTSI